MTCSSQRKKYYFRIVSWQNPPQLIVQESTRSSYLHHNTVVPFATLQTISIAGANILQGDSSFENVIIHVVDRVLYPIAESLLSQTIQAKYGYFYRLLQSSGLVEVLNSKLFIAHCRFLKPVQWNFTCYMSFVFGIRAGGLYTVFIPTQDALNNLPAETSKTVLSDTALLKRTL